MSDELEKSIVTCAHCGKRVRVKNTMAEWKCPSCDGLNENENYIPDAEPVDAMPSQSMTNQHRSYYSNPQECSSPQNDASHGVAGVGFAVSIVAFFLLFFFNYPLLFIVLGIIGIILCIADAFNTKKSCVIGTIGGILGVVVILIAVIAWVNAFIAVQQINDMYAPSMYDTLNNLGKH